MRGPVIAVTIVNHATIDIAVPPEIVWQAIQEHFVDTATLAKAGYSVALLDNPAVPAGGYHMRKEVDGEIDERVVHITENDSAARRLSLFANYRSALDGLLIYVTYHARDTASGACYSIDCHSQLGIAAPAGGAEADVAATIEGLKSQSAEHLMGYLERLKQTLEAQADQIMK